MGTGEFAKWALSAAPAIVGLAGGRILDILPQWAVAGLFATSVAAVAARALLPITDAPIFMGSVGAGLILSAFVYWYVDAGWKGREYYRPNIERMMGNLWDHASGAELAQDDDDYCGRQNSAHDVVERQKSWINDNIGGIAATKFAETHGHPNYDVKNPKLSAEIDKRRAEYVAELRAKADFLGILRKDDSEWPKGRKEIVRRRGVPKFVP
jgi:hypothetical protein